MRRNIMRISIIMLICFSLISIVPIRVKGVANVNILLISSYNPNFISFNDQIAGIRNGLDNMVDLQIEYMDQKTFDSQENEVNFYNLLKYKLSNYNEFDAIIVGDDEALEFVIKYRDELFKDLPITFLGVQNDKLIETALQLDLISGVKEVESVYDNVELIKNIHKDVEKIIVLEQARDNEIVSEFYEECVKKYKDIKFELYITNELELKEFKEIVKGFSSSDVVLACYPNAFKSGENYEPYDSMKIILDNTEVPVYSILSYGIGGGSIGGKVIDHYNQGKKAGEIVMGILNGENPKDIHISSDYANRYIFDYNAMKKFNIKESQLPKDSIILNKPVPFMEKYKTDILPMSLLLMGLISIIIALILFVINRIKYEGQLLKAKEIAENANRAKSHFVSNISHELRTPITLIMSAIQLAELRLKNSNVDVCLDNFHIANQNCYRLLRLTNNIIDVAKVDAGFQEVALKNVNAVDVLERIVLSIVTYAETKNIQVVFDTTDEEIYMALDCDKMERVILNLLSNAIKFSNESGIISTYLEKKEDKIIFTVEDNGIGISEEYLDKIFDRFTQVDDSISRKTEGSGIGLALVKGFVEMHNGNVAVQSKLGEGTRFIIEIPITLVDESMEKLEIKNEETSTIISTQVEFSDIYF